MKPHLRQAAFAACLAVGVAAPAARAQTPAAAPQASATEIEFWRSAERQGTPEAYRAYLTAFPGGAFAPLARAALGPVPAARAAASAVPALAPASPALRYFSSEATRTGAITFNLGDRFSGPGVITVGWAGAKKQYVLPPGEWVVLAAADTKVDHSPLVTRVPTTVIVDVGTLVLGRFSGTRLASAMVYVANVRPVTVTQWQDLVDCQRAAQDGLHHALSQPSVMRSECQGIRVAAAALDAETPAMVEARASLQRLGAQVHGAALVTIAALWEERQGYLGVMRLDWPGLQLGAAADSAAAWKRDSVAAQPAHAAYLRGLHDWLREYRAVAAEGYRHRIELPALKPGAPTASAATLVRDFDPTGTALK